MPVQGESLSGVVPSQCYSAKKLQNIGGGDWLVASF